MPPNSKPKLVEPATIINGERVTLSAAEAYGRTDQATEIADLMPLAKFGAKILKTKALFDVDAETFAFSLGLIEWLGSSLADPTIKPNIEATLEQLLKDTP